MDKALLIKVLGKEDSVKLEDQIYNLRDITDEIRMGLISDMSIFTEKFIDRALYELTAINKAVEKIKSNIEDPNNSGYTNSREYLKKYVNGIYNNIGELKMNLRPFNERLVINHNNLLCDAVLKY